MPRRWPSETKTPYPTPLRRLEDAPNDYVRGGDLQDFDLPPVPGPAHNGSNPPDLAPADHGHSNNPPNPDNYQPPSGPMTHADQRTHGLG